MALKKMIWRESNILFNCSTDIITESFVFINNLLLPFGLDYVYPTFSNTILLQMTPDQVTTSVNVSSKFSK